LELKTIILAGGFGTRISEETQNKPKPMVLINDKPILWHIMSIYALQGYTDFIIAGGYKCEVIEGWVNSLSSNWRIQVLNTGLTNQTGSRIFQAMRHSKSERYFVTYGDGLGNVDLRELLEFHDRESRIATVTAVRPPARFGVLESSNGRVTHFGEKNQADSGWINGGFFVVDHKLASMNFDDSTSFEAQILPHLVSQRNLSAYHHNGFWQPMDTLRERNDLSKLAKQEKPPWLKF
jgi:glucose-1-phosphate cytidylyltransferase